MSLTQPAESMNFKPSVCKVRAACTRNEPFSLFSKPRYSFSSFYPARMRRGKVIGRVVIVVVVVVIVVVVDTKIAKSGDVRT